MYRSKKFNNTGQGEKYAVLLQVKVNQTYMEISTAGAVLVRFLSVYILLKLM